MLEKYTYDSSSEELINRKTANCLAVSELVLARPLEEYNGEWFRRYEDEKDILSHSFFFDECDTIKNADFGYCRNCKICKMNIAFIRKLRPEEIELKKDHKVDDIELEDLL